ncbi:MAG: YabP/YqfC family sporulation protein [Clostridia bacterium]|nr:YabP/YqfC family sporulation protein [Clostridia bacterium]
MENYIQELSKICKLSFDEVTKNFKIIQLGSYGVYVCNYLKLLDYSSEKIVLKIKHNILEIVGEDLLIAQINKGEIVIRGKIFSTGLGLKNAKTR